MALTTQHWTKALTALQVKAREAGLEESNPQVLLELIREHWDLVASERDLDSFLEAGELARLRELRDQKEAALSAVDDQITELERRAP